MGVGEWRAKSEERNAKLRIADSNKCYAILDTQIYV
jgi:hypothetical protein